MKQITIVMEVTEATIIRDVWKSLQNMRKDIRPVSAEVGNTMEESQRYESIAKAAVQQMLHPQDFSLLPKILHNAVGTHFWLHPIGFYSNNVDIFKANLVYTSYEDLQAKEAGLVVVQGPQDPA